MGTLSIEAWAIIFAVIASASFATLYILSSILRDAARRVDLYRKVAELRADYARQLAELNARSGRGIVVVDAVDDLAHARRAA